MIDRVPKVVYWFNQPTPYVVARFNAISDQAEFDFEAWFSEVRQSDRSWDVDESGWRFPARYIPIRKIGPLSVRTPIVELAHSRPDLFVLEYDRLNLALGLIAGRLLARRVALRVLPNYDAWSHRTWWRELAKRFLFRAADAAKVPGPDGRTLAVSYGIPVDRVYEVRQSIDLDLYASARWMSHADRETRRQDAGLRGCVFLFVGRIWRGKGLDELVDAYKMVLASTKDASLLLVGDGVDEDRYRGLTKDLPNVVMTGFVQPNDLPRWYALADCFVFPTHGDPNGLVVEEALAAGLPVIVSDAAGDIRRRVDDGVVGCVVPKGSAGELATAMLRLALDTDVLEGMAARTFEQVADKSPSGYAADFTAFTRQVLTAPTRTGVAAAVCRQLARLLVVLARAVHWSSTMVMTPARVSGLEEVP